ncbi:MAG TPA: ABC transporter permease [Bryobacteraceae bacterium]|nr:ABC transporter permease [Bryobacteraceae bacterium]
MFKRRKRSQQDFSEELKAHLALEADQLRKEGLGERDAGDAAHRKFGNIVSAEETFYEASRWIWLEQLRQDIRYSFRQLRQSKGFTSVAVLTLALGIGANTSVFSLVHAVMLQNLPVVNPAQLFRLGDGGNCCVIGGYQGRFSIYSYPLYLYLRDHTPEFESMAAFQAGLPHFSVRRAGVQGLPDPFVGDFVSGNYFSMFGIRAVAGRTIQPDDDRVNAPNVAVMSYRAWQQHYALDPSVIGSTFVISGSNFTIVGVTPPGFFGDTLRSDPPDFWLPLAAEPVVRGQNSLLHRSDDYWLYIIGRLKVGANPSKVEAEVNLELKQWLVAQAGSDPSEKDRQSVAKQHITLAPAGGGVAHLQEGYADGLRLLMTASGLVLLIACANIANLLLARRTAGRIQGSIRLALGAPRHRLIRQTLVESLLLALLGGAAGIFVAFAGTRAILMLAFRDASYVPIQASPSLPVMGFAFLLSLVTGIVFGAVPAWISARFDPAEALRGANRSTGNRSTLPQKSLVVLQAALSLVLLVYAGLLTKSLRNLEHQQYGFDTTGRVMVRVQPAFAGYSPERLQGVYRQLEQRLPQISGVRSASFALYSPMNDMNWSSGIVIEGRPPRDAGGHGYSSSWDRVSPGYFETIGTRLLRGRAIDDRDTPNSRFVAVVNQTFVKKYFPNEEPLGKRFGLQQPGDYEIVGVVEDAKYIDARGAAWPTFFIPFLQMTPSDWTKSGLARSNYIEDIQLRVAASAKDLEQSIRRTIAEIDPNLTVLKVRSFSDQLSGNFNRERLLARLTALFGFLALAVASVGLYGITAYSVVRRTSEIGVRIALGASRSDVAGMVVRSALLQTALGLAIGIPAAIAGARVLANQLYGIQPTDPLMLGLATLLLAACALVAGLIPGLRAASIDPIRALRTE